MKLRGGLILFLGSLLLAGTAAGATGKLLGLKTSVDPQGTTILLQLPAPVEFTPSQVGPRLYLVDVAGISSDRPADNQPVASPLVSSYRIFSYQGADERPHMGVELTLKEEAMVQSMAVADGLQIRVQKVAANRAPAPATPAVATPSPFAAAVPSPAALRGASLREVSVVQPEGTAGLEIEILADNEFAYETSKLRNPERLVVDLQNTLNRIKQRRLDVNTPPLKAIRIAQFRNDPPVARVVLDLDSQVPYQIRNQTNGLVIALNGPDAKGVASQKVETPSPVAAIDSTPASHSQVHNSAALMEDSKAAAVAEKTEPAAGNSAVEAANEPAVERTEPVLLASNDPSKIATPASLTGAAIWDGVPATSEALAPGAKLSEVNSRSLAESAKERLETVPPSFSPNLETGMAAEPAMPAQSVAEVAPVEPMLLAQQTVATGAGAAVLQQQEQTFTGEPISLNLKDVDLKDYFRLMHEVSGLNVVLDPNVSGVVTIVLDEVPWDQAMDIVLQNNGLEARTVGNVVRIAKVSTLEAEAKAQTAKAQAEEQQQQLATPTQTVTRTLSYSTAGDLVTPLKRFLTARGDIVPDPRTNTLIITDVPPTIAKVDALLANLDRKTPQVEIEARIIAATRSFARDIGSQLAASGATGNVVLGGAGAVGESPIKRGTAPPLFIGTPPEPVVDPVTGIITPPAEFANLAQPLAMDFGAVDPSSGLSLVLTGGRFALDAIITAAEQKGLGKLLSRPKIITQNNVEGTVEQGVRIPIQTSVNNTITTQYINVTLRLTVTPQITAEGTIFLRTDIENTTINPGIPRILGQPALDTQSAETQVLVSDGGTVFFGGIIQTQNTLNEFEVPLLGSIPLVGNLFKRKFTSTETRELLFFITPKITQS
ncbi:MAG: type IV pilus secretin PilQ [Acidobacteria bacterium]|nr:type IV pilus secretin PilQ [Acidobacteriota bacterium]